MPKRRQLRRFLSRLVATSPMCHSSCQQSAMPIIPYSCIACTCVQIYVSKLRCESYSRRIQACIFGYDHQLNDDCSPKKCIANICNMHDTQMTSIEFCFLTKYSINNFADAEERFFIFFQIDLVLKKLLLSIMFKLLNMTFLCHISFSAKPASLFF